MHSTNICVFADGQVGLELVQWLILHHSSDVSCIVTIGENEIYNYAINHGCNCIVFHSESSLYDFYFEKKIKPDLGLLIWWPRIISSNLLVFPEHGFLNTHPSLLPFNRGKNYNFWAIVERAPFGVSIHFVDSGVDTGDILFQKEIMYGWEDNGETLYFKAKSAMVDLFKENYHTLRNLNFISRKKQAASGSFHKESELISASEINLDEKYIARDLLNLLRARTFHGYPSCYFYEGGQRYEVRVAISKD